MIVLQLYLLTLCFRQKRTQARKPKVSSNLSFLLTENRHPIKESILIRHPNGVSIHNAVVTSLAGTGIC